MPESRTRTLLAPFYCLFESVQMKERAAFYGQLFQTARCHEAEAKHTHKRFQLVLAAERKVSLRKSLNLQKRWFTWVGNRLTCSEVA